MAHVTEHGEEVCEKSPDWKKRHLWQVDRDDRRFRICAWCKIVKYRTDEELLTEARSVARRNKASET